MNVQSKEQFNYFCTAGPFSLISLIVFFSKIDNEVSSFSLTVYFMILCILSVKYTFTANTVECSAFSGRLEHSTSLVKLSIENQLIEDEKVENRSIVFYFCEF